MADDIGMIASAVLWTVPSPTMESVMPLTVPVKVGLFIGAFRSKALCKPTITATPTPVIVLPNDTGPLGHTVPFIVVVPDRTAITESAFIARSFTVQSTELSLYAREYTAMSNSY